MRRLAMSGTSGATGSQGSVRVDRVTEFHRAIETLLCDVPGVALLVNIARVHQDAMALAIDAQPL
jgi:hypothetical protein